MSDRKTFVTGSVYHLYNRGVAKQLIFNNQRDYERFLFSLAYYQEANPGIDLKTALKLKNFNQKLSQEPITPLVEILAYCLMPNHFHLVVRQMTGEGITNFTKLALNSYTRAYNTRHSRIGPLYQGIIQSVLVESDEQLLHLTRYVHLNPYVARLSQSVLYQWSSLEAYYQQQRSRLCHPELVTTMVGSVDGYRQFVEDYAGFAQSLAELKHHLTFEYN